MKRQAIIAATLMLTLGLVQCKKDQPAPQTTEGETIHITVNVDNGSKAGVTPGTGEVRFNSGDKLYVGYDGAYAGVLNFNGSAFSGNITISGSGQNLYFYYLGGMEAYIVNGVYTVDISNQISNYPVISCGASEETYPSEGNAYTTTLLNQCALVKFATNIASRTVKVTGMNTVASINFATGEITPDTQATPGTIKFITDGEGEGWAILLEQDPADDVAVTAVGYEDGTCNVPLITNNMYYTEGVHVTLTELTVMDSGEKGSVSYVLYSDYTLYLSGTGNVPAWAFNGDLDGNVSQVKKIIFAENCPISQLGYYMFRAISSSQLTDVEINTTVPLTIEAEAIYYNKGGDMVNFTITAPSVTFIKNGEHSNQTLPFINTSAGPKNIVFNVSEPITFETYTFNTLQEYDHVTIPAGCSYHVTGYQFTESYIQHEYENSVKHGNEQMFWEEYDYFTEGVDYTVTNTTEEITSSNASIAFGAATVTIR